MSSNAQLGDRKFIIGGFFCLIVLIYICRLFYIQLIDDQYLRSAQNNAFRYQTEYPVRGYVFDRNGKLLVYNSPSYDLMVIPRETKGCDTASVCEVLQITKQEYLRRIKKACQAPNSPRKESVFEKQMSPRTYAALQEKLYRFKGFFVQKRTVRKYPRPIAAHLLGYVGEISKEKAEKSTYYKEGDYIGISGIENSYESVLCGKKGTQIAITDVHNKVIGKYMDGKYDTAAISGKALYCSIDMDLQEYGERLMHGKKGALVAIEPSTGEILCLISSPSYDPNLLVGGKERSRNFTKLYYDTINRPLYNRALTATYPPGSTFKLIDALIAQNDGLISKSTVFPCNNGYPPGGGKPKCHPHGGGKDLIWSVAVSCNSYYSYVFREIVDQRKYPHFIDGYNHWRDMVKTFGPGTSLGTDLPFDKPGNVPSVKYYDKVFGKDHWRSNTIISLGIGQAELLLVPLQMANVATIVANRGYYYVPHSISGVGKPGVLDKRFKEKHYAGVQKQEYYENVIEGMQKCFEGGTASRSKIPDIIACGKTGTAQNPHGADHAEFQAFAPRENPKIVIACIVENAGFGHMWAAPITSLMIEKYLKGTRTSPARLEIEKRMLEADFINGKTPIVETK